MKTTKRARKNQARQKLKLESERITKDETQKNEVAADSDNCRSEIGVLIMAIVFSPIMIFLIYCSGNQFDDVYQSQIENRKAEHTETASKHVVDSLVDSFIGNEPLNETKSEDTEDAIFIKQHVEGIKKDNFTYPTVKQVLVNLFESVFYFPANSSANHKNLNKEVEIPREEIVENLSKEPSYLISLDSPRTLRAQQDIDELTNAIYNVGYQEEREGKIINVYERSKERDALIALVEKYKESKIDEKVFKKALNEFKPKYIKAVNATINQQSAVLAKINNTTQPSNEDYQKVVASNIHYLEYINTVNRAREDLSNNANDDDKEIKRVRVVPAVGGETKENIFVDIVNYESDKQPSKDEITENLKKESDFLLASENTEEGKFKNAYSESENQMIDNEQPIENLISIIIKDYPNSLAAISFGIIAIFAYFYIKEDEAQTKQKSKMILRVNPNKDLAKYSNKL